MGEALYDCLRKLVIEGDEDYNILDLLADILEEYGISDLQQLRNVLEKSVVWKIVGTDLGRSLTLMSNIIS